MSSEQEEGRISITGVPGESLAGKYFYDESESPTLGHLHALLNVANGRPITNEIKDAVLDTANRHKATLGKAVDQWNNHIRIGLGEHATAKFLAFSILLDTITLSYGSEIVDPQDRKMLILKAVDLAGRSINISPN